MDIADPNFQAALTFTLAREGGWHQPDPSDPNPTMSGVTQKTYDAYRSGKGLSHQSVAVITSAEVSEIYSGYWLSCGADQVAAQKYSRTAALLFDTAVNEGPQTAVKLLQRVLDVTEDGIIGENTLDALYTIEYDTSLALDLAVMRIRAYSTLVQERPDLMPNYLGWILRVLKFVSYAKLVNGV